MQWVVRLLIVVCMLCAATALSQPITTFEKLRDWDIEQGYFRDPWDHEDVASIKRSMQFQLIEDRQNISKAWRFSRIYSEVENAWYSKYFMYTILASLGVSSWVLWRRRKKSRWLELSDVFWVAASATSILLTPVNVRWQIAYAEILSTYSRYSGGLNEISDLSSLIRKDHCLMEKYESEKPCIFIRKVYAHAQSTNGILISRNIEFGSSLPFNLYVPRFEFSQQEKTHYSFYTRSYSGSEDPDKTLGEITSRALQLYTKVENLNQEAGRLQELFAEASVLWFRIVWILSVHISVLVAPWRLVLAIKKYLAIKA